MKSLFSKWALLCFALSIPTSQLLAQCNVNDKYDKIISGYHSSIALKDDGVYAVWGSDMQAAGNADQLSPQDINSTNYSGLTGTIYKAALGGKSAGSAVDQAILLTSDGLWAWGIEGNVLNNSLTASSTFNRITSPTGAATTGLPTGVTPSGVAGLVATYQTLILLTTTGNVWILTQTNQTVEANGGSTTTAGSGSSQWKQVKTDATHFLTNVTAVRGQVSTNALNAFIALTSTGGVYTWGNSTYLGDGSNAAARNFATSMTLPVEFSSSNIPKMIGVTGGTSTTSTTKNTYYLLSNSGSLYALGDNTQKQCADFSTTERKSWVNAKINSTTNFTNVNFFSCQEHNASYPGCAAITTTGSLYTWGNNSAGMLGRTTDNTSSGSASGNYDPGIPVGFTGTAISVELGGHTMVYLKEGSSQFCYVGHQTNGSMGDGTTTMAASNTTVLNHNCSSTPALSICGSVPTAGSSANSTISASPTSIIANASSTAIITIQLKDAGGTNLTSSGGVVTVTTTAGTLGTVTDNNDGTYTVTLTSGSSVATATLGFSINGTAATGSAQVLFTATLPLTWTNIQAVRQKKIVKISWTTAAEVNVKDFDIERSLNGSAWSVVIADIPATNTNGNHSYEQFDTAFNSKLLIYRIRQTDNDGHYTYSPAEMVPAIADPNKITVYPNPADNSFHLSNVSSGIKTIQLIGITGNLLKTWNGYQSFYDIQNIPAGSYILRIETNDDIQILKLKK